MCEGRNEERGTFYVFIVSRSMPICVYLTNTPFILFSGMGWAAWRFPNVRALREHRRLSFLSSPSCSRRSSLASFFSTLSGGVAREPFTARIGRAHSYRARSASKEAGPSIPSSAYSFQNFLIRLFNLPQILPKPILVHRLLRRLIPESAGVRRNLIGQDQLAIV